MMSMKTEVAYQVELANEFWNRGWAGFRTQSNGTGDIANADVIAVGNGDAAFLNVEVLRSGTSTKKVLDETKGLKQIKRRADDSSMGSDFSVIVGHAFYKEHLEQWCYGDINSSKLYAKDKSRNLFQVIV